jgi:hypothetical protein
MMRHRSLLVIVAAVLALVLRVVTDPDGGLFKTASFLIALAEAFVVISLVHWARKAYLDYGRDTDMRSLFKIASPGHALIAIAIFFLAFAVIFSSRANAQDVRTYIPPQAMQYLPTLKAEVTQNFGARVPAAGYHGALIEHESGCFAYKTKCWNPHSQLKSAREQGAGLGQITRAYRKDGSQRFDALQEMVARYPQLRGWNWGNVLDRPDLQMRAVVLKTSEDFRYFIRLIPDPMQALAFADAAYNGGRGDVEKERRACHLAPGCDPKVWTGNVERYCMKSREPIYGGRSACDINRTHVRDVFVRSDKYARWLT